jgi:hypothetical protein
MKKASKRNKATHTTRPNTAKLETPKSKPTATSKNSSASPTAPINLTGGHMANAETTVMDFISAVTPKIDELLVEWHESERGDIRDAVIAVLEAAHAEGARLRDVKEAPEYDKKADANKDRPPYCSTCDEFHHDDECQAAQSLANAFATIERCRDLIPARIYNKMADAMHDYYQVSNWESDPYLLKEVLPHILRMSIENHKRFVLE